MHGFAARHGWRAYALPVLIVLTVVVVLQPAGWLGLVLER